MNHLPLLVDRQGMRTGINPINHPTGGFSIVDPGSLNPCLLIWGSSGDSSLFDWNTPLLINAGSTISLHLLKSHKHIYIYICIFPVVASIAFKTNRGEQILLS